MRSTGTAKKQVSTIGFSAVPFNEESANLDDDHIETTIFTRFVSTSDAGDVPDSRPGSPSSENDESNTGHGKTLEGTVACCRKFSDGLVNCNSCLNLALSEWFAKSDAKERQVCRRVLNILETAGPAGLDVNALVVSAH